MPESHCALKPLCLAARMREYWGGSLPAVLAGAVGALEGEAFSELFLNTSFSSGSEIVLAVLIPQKGGHS